jgi:UDP-N-acetyl-D-galactosamine dehydrogenase
MPSYVANKVLDLMFEEKIDQKNARVLILGFSFKENCPDYRNTKIVDLFLEMKGKVKAIDIFDPWVDAKLVAKEHHIKLISNLGKNTYDAVILAVAHDIFLEYKMNGFKELLKERSVIYDIKHFLDPASITARL